MRKIVLASTNKGKLKEFKASLLDGSGCILGSKNRIEFVSIDELTSDFDVEETGTTFIDNAILKAKAGAVLTHEYCLADDSGIEIDALGGRPGIYSGRYLKGEDLSAHEILVEKYLKEDKQDQYCIGLFRLLEEMKGKTNRASRFVCTLVLADPSGKIIFQTEKYWEGIVSTEPKGNQGFGYDPIVIPKNLPEEYKNLQGKTVAELDSEIKNKLSHRAQAIESLKAFLS